MSNPWHSLNMNFGVTDDSFNDVVSNSQYLDLGAHPGVFVEGIEPGVTRTNNPYLKIVWSNDDKQTTRDSAFINSRPDDNGNIHPHFTLRRLMAALIPDKQLRTEFMGAVAKNPALFSALVGLRADIKIGLGRNGYTVKEAPAGGVILWDVGTNEQVGTDVYEDYSAAKSAAEELGLKRCYNEVAEIQSSEAYKEANLNAVQAAISTASQPAQGGGVRGVPAGAPRRNM